jgi:hypothetical protein
MQLLSPLELPTEDEATTKDESQPAVPPLAPITPTYLVPSLRGRLSIEGITHVCRGVWALSDDHHDQPGQTSDFEFRLVKPAPDNARAFPMNGKYHGFFMLKQPPPLKSSIKIEDKDMMINFAETTNGEFSIDGEGSNKFGKFSLRGTLFPDGRVQMYRVYLSKPVVPKRSLSGSGTPTATPRKRPLDVATAESPRPIIVAGAGAPDSARTRKRTNVGDESSNGMVASTPAAFSPRATVEVAATPRAPRLSQHLIKCGEMLKEMFKHPQSVWFLEPVDPVKLNIPDYPLIVKEPMDLGTIKSNLERNIYAGPEGFAEHVRLVFKNALTYNQMRDHPVHIAAREMSSRFEERYRLLLSQLGLSYTSEASVSAGPKKAKGPKLASTPSAASSSSSSKGRPAPANVTGPRSTDVFLPPPLDSSAHHLAEMQRRMEEMHNEIMKLRTEVKQNELRIGVGSVYVLICCRSSSVSPMCLLRFSIRELQQLSFEEKKNLIAEISRLPANKMVEVVEIIRQVIPADSGKEDSDEIEIPLDELDTATLRKLQKFVAVRQIYN